MTRHAGCGLSADTPSQVGFVWKVQHKKSDGSLLIGYEYRYDLLGRVVQSVERPSGDVTSYAYTPAGRLESEGRTGQVAYSRTYAYNPDGSRDFVIRDDAVNGSHWDLYSYDAVSGRLESVLDVWTDEVNSFVWNAEGTLARWIGPVPTAEGQSITYERLFEYDERDFLTRFSRREGVEEVHLLQEFRYNGDGCLVHLVNYWENKEYRFGCSLGCGTGIMRTYSRPLMGLGGDWMAQEDYVHTPTSWWFSDPFASGELRSPNAVWYQDLRAGGGVYAGYVKDSFDEPVGIPSPWSPLRPMPPFYHPVPPPLDLPRPVLPGNIIDLITCRIKAVSVVIVVFPPIGSDPPGGTAPPNVPSPPFAPGNPSVPMPPGGNVPPSGGYVPPGSGSPFPGAGFVPGRDLPSFGLCYYICKHEYKFPFCRALCELLEQGCDRLFWACMRSRNNDRTYAVAHSFSAGVGSSLPANRPTQLRKS